MTFAGLATLPPVSVVYATEPIRAEGRIRPGGISRSYMRLWAEDLGVTAAAPSWRAEGGGNPWILAGRNMFYSN